MSGISPLGTGSPLGGGVADPTFAAQAVFRAVLDAMARPGTIVPMPAAVAPPAPLSATTAAVLLALADADTPVFLDAALAANEAVARYLRFHTGAPTTEDPAAASFAAISAPETMPPLAAFATGSADYPDRSTTLILAVTQLGDGSSAAGHRFHGPGIDGSRSLAFHPAPAEFDRQWRDNRALFPCGIDLILAGPAAVAALPRSSAVGRE